MTVISEGPLCLKIHLNKYELKKYFNSYNEINIEDPNAKRTIGILFNIAVNMSTFEINGKRLIEVFPTPSGGCIFKFTSDPLTFESVKNHENRKLKLKNQKSKNNPYIFCFKNFENLLTVIEKLYKYFTSNPHFMPDEYKNLLSVCDTDVVVCDYIAGMTDNFCVKLFNELFMPIK